MVSIEKATIEDTERLTEVQTRTFEDDNRPKGPGCSMEGRPGLNSVGWNADWIAKTPYYMILFDGRIVGGIIVFDMGEGHYELGQVYDDPDFQNRGIGQQVVRLMFGTSPEAERWTVGTPSWAICNQHFYERMGFVKVRETEVDPDLGWSGIEYEKNCNQARSRGSRRIRRERSLGFLWPRQVLPPVPPRPTGRLLAVLFKRSVQAKSGRGQRLLFMTMALRLLR
jgi:GNAT superfamily N-acetyltransferase